MENIGERVARRRKELKITQTQLAEAIGVKQQTIQYLENGATKASRHLPEIAKILGCSYEYLKAGDDEDLSSRPFSLNNIPYDLAGQIIKDAGYDPAQLVRLLVYFKEHFPDLESQRSRERYLRLIMTAAKGEKKENGLPGADWIAQLVLLTST